jgi:hypothetical protein
MPQSFGQFSAGPDGRFVSGSPRPRFRLLASFGFRDPNGRIWEVPAGVEVDGASIPRAFWTVIGGPFEGNYLNASVVHDHFCRVRTRSAQDTHRTFYYGMRAMGVSEPQAKRMFWAVTSFGPDWQLGTPRDRGEEAVGGRTESVAVAMPEVDLDDAATRARADERFREISEVLQESEGARMPDAAAGTTDASLESIEADAARFRGSLTERQP